MAQLAADQDMAGQTLPLGLVINPPTYSGGVPMSDPSFYNVMAAVQGLIIASMQVGTVRLIKQAINRPEPWKGSSTIIELPPISLVAYVGGDYYVKEEGRIKTHRKLIIAGHYLGSTVIDPNDVVEVDGRRYSLSKTKRVPRAGPITLFWNIELELL